MDINGSSTKKAPNSLKVKVFCRPDGEFSLNSNSSQTTMYCLKLGVMV